MEKASGKVLIFLICLALTLMTIVAFEQVRRNDFIGFDDDEYVTRNPNVYKGVSVDSFIWACSTSCAGNWHPLTWLSHMLDCEMYGLKPAGHHITNLLLHTVNTLLLFWVLRNATGGLWRSAFVAVLFALHPLHVESVAWVAERKDILSGFFWMLTIAAYIRYAKRPAVGRYLWLVLFFGLGLTAKPMLVTLPFVLLLLDWWPLGRFQRLGQDGLTNPSLRMLIVEKIPLFVLTIGSCIITYVVQQSSGATALTERLSLSVRVSNALVSYAAYLCKMFYPVNLAIYYPHPLNNIPLWQPIVAFITLAFVSVFVIYLARRQRYLIVGWLWYIGTLVPVIGLVQVGEQAMADRYTYLPLTGIFIMIAWGAAELAGKRRYRQLFLVVPAGLVLVALLMLTRVQVNRWQNSIILFEHTLGITENNYRMHNNLGMVLVEEGEADKAVEQYRLALGIRPNHVSAMNNLGVALLKQGKVNEAVSYLLQSAQISPTFQTYNNLGTALARQGKSGEAVEYYQKGLEMNPDDADAHTNLGNVLRKLGRAKEAVEHHRRALEIDPYDAKAHYNLGIVLGSQGNIKQAIRHWTEAVRLQPDSTKILNNLAWVLAVSSEEEFHDPEEAILLAQRACELTGFEDAVLLDTLAAAYGAAGRFSEAVETAEKAIELAESAGRGDLGDRIRKRLESYKAGEGWRE